MRCEEVTELMQRSLDDDLSPEEHAEMEEHLRECDECQGLYAGLKYVSLELENLPEVEPPISIVDSILPQIMPNEIALASEPRTGMKIPPRVNWKKMALISGSVAAVLVIGIFTAKGLDSSFSDSAKESAAVEEKAAPSTAMNIEQPEGRAAMSQAEKEGSREMPDQAEPSLANPTAGQQEASDKQATALAEPGKNKDNSQAAEPDLGQQQRVPEVKSPDAGEAQPAPQQQGGPEQPPEEQLALSSVPEQPGEQAEPEKEQMAMSSPEPIQPNMALVAPTEDPESGQKAKMADSAGIYPSPTGSYTAHVEGQMVVILDGEGSEVFRSHQWSESAQVMIDWQNDHELVYQIRPVTDEKEAPADSEKWLINVTEGQEQKQ